MASNDDCQLETQPWPVAFLSLRLHLFTDIDSANYVSNNIHSAASASANTAYSVIWQQLTASCSQQLLANSES